MKINSLEKCSNYRLIFFTGQAFHLYSNLIETQIAFESFSNQHLRTHNSATEEKQMRNQDWMNPIYL